MSDQAMERIARAVAVTAAVRLVIAIRGVAASSGRVISEAQTLEDYILHGRDSS